MSGPTEHTPRWEWLALAAAAFIVAAALLLAEFVDDVPWVHIDLMAWNTESKPGRPEGGEAQGMRAVYAYLEERFGQ